jgi:hypothetical protein
MRQKSDSAYWHDQAEKARVIAELMSDPGARNTMYELAARWDEVADNAENRARASARA